MSRHYVYAHLDQNGIVRYIGKGCRNRAWNFLQRSKLWNETFPKDNPPEVVLLKTELDEWDALQAEISAIADHLKMGFPLLNIASGGVSGWDERASKMLSEMRSGSKHHYHGKKRDPEVVAKMKKTKAENPQDPYWLGKKRDPDLMKKLVKAAHTPEALAKAKATKKAHPTVYTEERREKLRKAMLDRPMTDEIKAKISAKRKAQGNFRTGAKLSDESKARMSQAATGRVMSREAIEKRAATIASKGGLKNPMAKQVRCVETGDLFRSPHEAAEKMFAGVGEKVIQQVCVGKKKGYRGYKFEHAT